mgnify:CR=1 FL=1
MINSYSPERILGTILSVRGGWPSWLGTQVFEGAGVQAECRRKSRPNEGSAVVVCQASAVHDRGWVGQVVNTTTGTDTSAYYCKLCDCSLKDSLAWLDHINGKKRTCHTAAPPSL